MTTVWVVMRLSEGDGDDSELAGVFTTEERANNWVQWFEAYTRDELTVKAVNLNEAVLTPTRSFPIGPHREDYYASETSFDYMMKELYPANKIESLVGALPALYTKNPGAQGRMMYDVQRHCGPIPSVSGDDSEVGLTRDDADRFIFAEDDEDEI